MGFRLVCLVKKELKYHLSTYNREKGCQIFWVLDSFEWSFDNLSPDIFEFLVTDLSCVREECHAAFWFFLCFFWCRFFHHYTSCVWGICKPLFTPKLPSHSGIRTDDLWNVSPTAYQQHHRDKIRYRRLHLEWANDLTSRLDRTMGFQAAINRKTDIL